jgi:hypothetical protein
VTESPLLPPKEREGHVSSFRKSPGPEYKVREIDGEHFVIDVHWPYGSIEQLVGVFATRAHALRWLLEDGVSGK